MFYTPCESTAPQGGSWVMQPVSHNLGAHHRLCFTKTLMKSYGHNSLRSNYSVYPAPLSLLPPASSIIHCCAVHLNK